ncbi:MAG: hypothetical protein IKT98_08965 [Selenomonadaceae bacterium]|nr:hypothetical protein [Selenomonadaceae bacterium]
MNVAILGTDQASQVVTNIIENGYNPWLRNKLAEPINVIAYVSGGELIPLLLAIKSF